MPKVESIIMPSGGTFLGRCWRADHLRGRACGAQCLFRSHRKTDPFGAAARSEHHLCLDKSGTRRPSLAAAASFSRMIDRMDALRSNTTRRNVVRGFAAATASFVLPCPSYAQSSARVVVIGGGFGGAACARALRNINPKLQVTLVEPNRTFTACPFSNEVIAGLRDIEAQQFGYDRIAAERRDRRCAGRDQSRSASAHRRSRRRHLARLRSAGAGARASICGSTRLPGYDEAAAAKMPHAWKAGEQTLLLRRQLEAMEDGGTVVLAVPATPYRCPPAPYERASLIAHYLKAKKPRSKILILDAKDTFSQQRLFEKAWKEFYPGMIERIPLSQGGRVVSVEPATNTLVTDFGNYDAQVANVIPPQKAGSIAEPRRRRRQDRLVPDRSGDICLEARAQHPRHRRCLHRRRRRRNPRPLRMREGKACAAVVASLIAGNAAGKTDARRHLLQHRRARLCVFAVWQLPAAGRYVRRDDGLRLHEPGQCAERVARSAKRIRRRPGSRRSRWKPLANAAVDIAGCASLRRCWRCLAWPAHRNCGPMPSPAMRLRNR